MMALTPAMEVQRKAHMRIFSAGLYGKAIHYFRSELDGVRVPAEVMRDLVLESC